MYTYLGMALMAIFAQMFLSKVAFMSGAALLLAKVALLFSALVIIKISLWDSFTYS